MSRRIVPLALALLMTALPSVARADIGPLITDLRVAGENGDWTAETSFKLHWKVNHKKMDDVVAVHLRLLAGPQREELETIVVPLEAEDRVFGGEAMSKPITIPAGPGGGPAAPGMYAIDAWARTDSGDHGPAERVTIKLDNRQPGPALPSLDATWFRADVAPILRIAHPTGPMPDSGIRGYAVSLHPGSAAPPCAGADRCSASETDLAAGIENDTLSLGLLPEGDYVASVVAVSNTGMRSAVPGSVLVRVDATRPDVTLAEVGDSWSSRPVRVVARASDPLSGMAAAGPTGPRTAIAVDGGAPTVAQGPEVATTVSGSGLHTVAASARDAAGNVRGEGTASPPLTALVRIDEEPPSIAFVRAGDADDPELLEAVLADPLSGPAPGGSIGVRPLGSNQAFEPLPTRSAEGRLSARWDSDAYPPGSYEFRATGHDGAGNPASSTRRSGGAALVLANPLKLPSAVRFGFGGRRLVWHRCERSGESRRCRREVIEAFGRRPATRVVPYGRGVGVSGQAISAAGAPLAGVTVELVESFDPGASATTRVTRLQTGADGTFFARLAPGPSRQVEARFGGSRLLTRSSSRALRLGVQTAVRLRASATQVAVGGRPVVFSGRVLRAETTIPAYGRPVQLQFRLQGMPWTEFRTVQTDRLGRFRYPYSFSDDDSRGVRFLFRAYAPPQPGWPYEPAASRPLAVTGY